MSAVLDALSGLGLRFWVDTESIKGQGMWPEQVAVALAQSPAVLCFLSASSMQSDHVAREMHLALEKDKEIVVLALDTSPVSPQLAYALAAKHRLDVSKGISPAIANQLADELQELALGLSDKESDGRVDQVGPAPQLTAAPFLFYRAGLVRQVVDAVDRSRVVVLHGPAGIGKSVIATLAVREIKARYAAHVEIRCRGPAAVEPGFVLEAINDMLSERGRGLPSERISRSPPAHVLRQLATRLEGTKTLVVLDGVEELASTWLHELVSGLSSPHDVHLLLTSRNVGEPLASFPSISVPELKHSEALEFIQQGLATWGITEDPAAIKGGLDPGVATHPQALTAVISQVHRLPTELIVDGTQFSAVTSLQDAVGVVVANLPLESARVLALLACIEGLPLTDAIERLGLETPEGLPSSLGRLLDDALVWRRDGGYQLYPFVAWSVWSVWKKTADAAGSSVADAWRRSWDDSRAKDLRWLATSGAHISTNLASRHQWETVLLLGDEDRLERINLAGCWKEYSTIISESIAAASALGQEFIQFRMLCRLVRKRQSTGDRQGAWEALEAAAALVPADGFSPESADFLSHRALLVGADDSEGALQDLAGSRQIREHFGDRTGVAVTDKLVGNLYLRQRRYDVARQSLESASRSFRDLGDIKNLVEVEESLALCDLEEGDIRSAESRLNNAIARAEGVGYAAGVARGWLTLAMVREREGSVDAAVAAARSAYRVETNPDLRISLAARLIASRLGSDEKGSRP